MSFNQLQTLLETRAKAKGYELKVKLQPWPGGGSCQKVRWKIVVPIDSRLPPFERLHALAHESGHILLGHYELDDEVWLLQDGEGDSQWEAEANLFAALATRTPGTPAGWFLDEQLKLRLEEGR